MGKWIGAGMIVAACAGILGQWYLAQKEKQRVLMEFIRLLSSWEHCLSAERKRLGDYLKEYNCRDKRVELFLEELERAIEERCFPSGHEIWHKVLACHGGNFGLNASEREIFCQMSEAFFGRNQAECIRCTRDLIGRLQEDLERDYKDFLQKQKVYMPVGMLGGVLLVIFFL